MNCNRVKWGAGLMALVVLTFGLAGCGSEPAPVVQPPAPPPAPPPFQPQPVEVALGESGTTVTLMTAEGGGYTLNGEAFAGGEVEAENGNKYLLALEDDKWTAVFQMADGIEVMLGDHGGTVTITKAEDGTYWIGEMGIESGGSVTAENGNMYTLTMTMDEEGNVMWSAAYVPMEGMVTVASLGLEIAAMRAEDGTWTAVHPLTQETITLTEGGMIMAGDNSYMLSSDGMGNWMATFVMPDPESVMLGMHGGTVMLQRAEDGTWWYDGELFESGGMIMGSNGQYYTLTMGDDGMWMAMWNKPDPVSVTLGTSGTVMLQMAEDNSWWIGDMAFSSGDSYTAANGNMYMLTYREEDGMWHSDFQPASMMIAGTGLTAMSREDGMGYDVMGSEDTIPESGMGGIMVGDAMYQVWMDDGMLMGARVDDPAASDTVKFHISGEDADGDTIGAAGLSGEDDAGLLAALGYDADVETTVATEKNAYLKVDGEYYSLGTLFSTGQADRAGKGRTTIVSSALAEIQDLRAKAAATLDVFPDAADAATLESALDRLWADTQDEVDKIFGMDGDDPAVRLKNAENDEEILDDFDTIIDALSEESAFAAATEKDGDGVFEAAELDAEAAAKAFVAESTEATATFGALGDTRFGAVSKKGRSKATADLGDPGSGDLGAFAYSTIDHTQRTRFVRQGSGSAFYRGETLAVDGKGTFFMGDIEIQVRFAAERVNGVITNLRNSDGAWEYLYNDVDVEQIVLPDARLGNTASWDDSGSDAEVHYSTLAGLPRPVSVGYMFKGRLVGRDSGDQGNQAVGVWSINEPGDGVRYLAGGFGAVRGADLADPRPEPDTGAGAEAKVLPEMDILPTPTDAQIAAGITLTSDTTDNPSRGTVTVTVDGVSTTSIVDFFHNTDNPDTRGQTIADGMLKIIGQAYGIDGMAIQDQPLDNTNDETTAATTGNQSQYRTHKIDLAAAIADGAPAWANGDTHVSLAKDKIEKQLRILESDIGLAASVKTKAWMDVQDAILDHLFGVLAKDGNGLTRITPDPTDAADATEANPLVTDALGNGDGTLDADDLRIVARAGLPGQLGLEYNENRNRNFVDAVIDVLEALESHDDMKVALAEKGIFYREAMAETNDAGTATDPSDDYQVVTQAMLAKKNGKGPGDVNLVDRVNSRVQYYVSGTDFTRFGAWHRQTSTNANSAYASRTDTAEGDGPNSFAYSPLKATAYITPPGGGLDSRFPAGARMTYKGDTLAVQDGKFYEGAIDVEVLWNSTSLGGMVNMSVSDIENVADGSRLMVDLDITAAGAPEELVGIRIEGVAVDSAMKLALGRTAVAEDTTTTPPTPAISEVLWKVQVMSVQSGQVGVRTTDLHASSAGDGVSDGSNADVGGYFVGQGLSGPLAVLGTWDFTSTGTATGNTNIGVGHFVAVDADNPTTAAARGVSMGRIHGAFGAEAP